MRQSTYKNGFYDWDQPTRNSDPAVYTVSVKPTEHRGFLIFERMPKRSLPQLPDRAIALAEAGQ